MLRRMVIDKVMSSYPRMMVTLIPVFLTMAGPPRFLVMVTTACFEIQ